MIAIKDVCVVLVLIVTVIIVSNSHYKNNFDGVQEWVIIVAWCLSMLCDM